MLDLIGAARGRGAAVLYATHYLHEVEQLDMPVILLNGGRVEARGPLKTLVHDPIVELSSDAIAGDSHPRDRDETIDVRPQEVNELRTRASLHRSPQDTTAELFRRLAATDDVPSESDP
jgi:ABC-type multidrug transport system ATPase subunit